MRYCPDRFAPVAAGCVFFLLFAVIACAPRLRTIPYELPPQPEAKPDKPTAPRTVRKPGPRPCMGWEGYLPDIEHPEYLPQRLLRVNIHILDNKNGNAHRPADTARVFMRRLLDLANTALDTNVRNWQSPEGVATLPRRYRYVLTPQPDRPGDDGIYLHYDDEQYFFVSQGRNQNNYSRSVIDKYGIGIDSIVNIFVQVHPPDSFLSKTYRANGQGIALGTALKMAGVLESQEGPESFEGLLNHEIGHLLNLPHAWMEDGCPDTNNHPNRCWDWVPEGPCQKLATNNMMDYNAQQIALTPCQIGRIHASLSNEKEPMRKCLIPTWCTYHKERTIVMRDSVHWQGARDLEGDLVIATGGVLTLSCRVSMPPGSRILVMPGAELRLDGARLHNDCGKTWAGIFVQRLGEQTGKVTLVSPSEIQHTAAANKALTTK
jgi:hypothetical protein